MMTANRSQDGHARPADIPQKLIERFLIVFDLSKPFGSVVVLSARNRCRMRTQNVSDLRRFALEPRVELPYVVQRAHSGKRRRDGNVVHPSAVHEALATYWVSIDERERTSGDIERVAKHRVVISSRTGHIRIRLAPIRGEECTLVRSHEPSASSLPIVRWGPALFGRVAPTG